MRRAAFLVVLSLIAQAAAGQDAKRKPLPAVDPAESEHELNQHAATALKRNDYTDARQLYLKLLREYPETRYGREAVAGLFKVCEHDSLRGLDDVMACLRDIHNNHPNSSAGREVGNPLGGIHNVVSWRFGQVPQEAPPGDQLRIGVDVAVRQRLAYEDEKELKRDLPKYRVFRVSDAPFRRLMAALNIAEKKDEDDPEKQPSLDPADHPEPRERWQLLKSEATLYIPVATRRGVADASEKHDLLRADLRTPGLYAVEQEIDGFRRTSFVRVVTFGIVARALGGRAMVYAVNPWSGEPVAGVNVQLRAGAKIISGRTNEHGLLFFDAPRRAYIVAQRGDEWHACHLEAAAEPKSDSFVFITTDRPLYRPGQIVHYKAVLRLRQGAVLSKAARTPVRVEVRDEEGRIMQEQQLAWNEFGSLSGSFQIGDEPRLGKYSITVHLERPNDLWEDNDYWPEEDAWQKNWRRDFVVAAYRKPEFQVKVEPESPVAIAGATQLVKIRADYFFGKPVADAEVEWSVTAKASATSANTWQETPFEDPHAWFYEGQDRLKWYRGDDDWWQPQSEEVVASGKGRTGSDGSLTIRFDRRKDARPMTYTVEAKVRDISRMVVVQTAEIESHPAALKVNVGTTRLFYQPGELVDARVRVTDLAGAAVPNQEVQLAAFMATDSELPGDFESFYSGKLRSDKEGRARVEFKAPRDGVLRLRAVARDAAGRLAQRRINLWIAGEAAVDQDQDLRQAGVGYSDTRGDQIKTHAVTLALDRLACRGGETARLMIRSAREPLVGLLSIEGPGFVQQRIVGMKSRCEVVEIAAQRDFPPNVRIAFFAWKDGQFASHYATLFIMPADKFLDVDVKAHEPTYAPRQKAKVTIQTRLSGIPAAAEVELGIVDESVLSLLKDRTPDMRIFFYPERFYLTRDASTLPYDGGDHEKFAYSELSDRGRWESPSYKRQTPFVVSVIPVDAAPAGGGGFFAGGGESGGPQLEGRLSLVISQTQDVHEPAKTEIRGRFTDTFFWSAHVRTDAQGRANLEIDVPDTLSRWRILARAVAGNDQFGVGTSSVVTRKDVIVRLIAPRFYTQRDEGIVSTIVRNDLKEAAEFLVRLRADGAEAGGEQRVQIPARQEKRLDWPIKITQAGTVRLKAEALSAAASDAMELTIPVRPYGVEVQVARSGAAAPGWVGRVTIPDDVDLQTASLEVAVGSGYATVARDALPFLADYPYGCVEQTMSRFLPAIAASQAMKRLGIANKKLEEDLPLMVRLGLERLYGFQHDDGGWGWWKHDKTDETMTTYVLYGLLLAEKAGYQIEPKTLRDGLKALRGMKQTPFVLYVRHLAGDDLDLKDAHTNARDPRQLAYLVLAGRKDLAAKLPAAPPKECTGESVQTTALVMQALASVDTGDPRVAQLGQWLLERRRGGRWISTLDTAYAVMAFASAARPGEEPTFELLVNKRKVAQRSGRYVLGSAQLRRGENSVEIRAATSPVYASVLLTYFSTRLDDLDRDSRQVMTLARQVERAVLQNGHKRWQPLKSGEAVRVSDELRFVVRVRAKQEMPRVMIEAPLAAGCEPPNEEIDEDQWDSLWYGRRELRDDRVAVAANHIDGQQQEFDFRLRPTLPGTYQVLPGRAFAMYEPDKQAWSKPFVLRIVDK